MAKWQWYLTSNVTLNTSCSKLYHKDCPKSILPSPTVSSIQITRKPRNSEYSLNVNTQQRHKLNSGSKIITLSAIGSWISLLHQWPVIPSALKPVTSFPPRKDVRNYSLQEIPFYRISMKITMFREAFQEFLSRIKHIQSKTPISFY